jgi:hypothetical protein
VVFGVSLVFGAVVGFGVVLGFGAAGAAAGAAVGAPLDCTSWGLVGADGVGVVELESAMGGCVALVVLGVAVVLLVACSVMASTATASVVFGAVDVVVVMSTVVPLADLVRTSGACWAMVPIVTGVVSAATDGAASAEAPATTVAAMAVVASVPVADAIGAWASIGNWASHESGPIVQRSRPSERLTKARTTVGSNCEPAQRTSSARAQLGGLGRL